MLAYLLALIVGLSSFGLYMAAFFFPEVHRKNDFLWSGLGLFYALVLWVCAGRITGGVLLGQTASVTLLGWLGWQTLTLRRQFAPVDQQTAVPTAAEWQQALLAALTNVWNGLSKAQSIAPFLKPMSKQVARLTAWLEALVTTTTKPTSAPPTSAMPTSIEAKPYVPLTPADFANAKSDAARPPSAIVTDVALVETDNRSSSESPLAAIAKQVQGSFKGLTAKRESKPVYVRKQFRAPDEVQTVNPPLTTVAAAEAKTSAHPNPEGSSAIQPEPAIVSTTETVTEDAINAVIAEAEATIPSITVEAESIPQADQPS